MSLLSAAEHLAALDRSAVVLDSGRCLHSQLNDSDCQACFSICPVNAIQPGKPPTLAENKCQTCLACLTVCPTGAYSADDAVAALLTCASRIEDPAIEVVCSRHQDASSGIAPIGVQVRGCLAGLGSGAMLALAAIGIQQVHLRLDACKDCPWSALEAQVRQQAEHSNRLHGVFEPQPLVTCLPSLEEAQERPLWDAANPPLSRRDLFRLAARQGKVALARTMLEQPAGERKAGRNRLRLNEAINHIRQEKPAADTQLDFGSYAVLRVSEACSACQACERACPTHSLHLSKGDEENYFWLKYNPQTCIACGNCTRVCLPQAIEVNTAPQFSQVYSADGLTTLSEGDLVQCRRCKTWFAAQTGSELCPVCDFRQKNPFGSVLPAAIRNKTRNSEKKAP